MVRPSAFALSESEASRRRVVFASSARRRPAFVDAAELAALLRSAADSASVEVLDAMEWDPYDATFASDETRSSTPARPPWPLWTRTETGA